MVSTGRQSTEKSMKHLLLAAVVLGVAFCFGKSLGIWWLIVATGKQFYFGAVITLIRSGEFSG